LHYFSPSFAIDDVIAAASRRRRPPFSIMLTRLIRHFIAAFITHADDITRFSPLMMPR
jgi:hypothetical protein